MGMNYYSVRELGNGISERIHIGKSSCGWVFLLHRVPERGLVKWGDWVDYLRKADIQDEDGNDVSFRDMVRCVTERKFEGRKYPYGMRGTAFASALEHAQWVGGVIGPNGLWRCQLRRGVEWGEGTWDYIDGEFS